MAATRESLSSSCEVIDLDSYLTIDLTRDVMSDVEFDEHCRLFYGEHSSLSLSEGAAPLQLPAASKDPPPAAPALPDKETVMSIDPGTKNMGVVIVDTRSEELVWSDVMEIELGTARSVAANSVNLFYKLDDLREKHNVRYVVWERQCYGSNNLRSDGMFTMLSAAWKGYGFVTDIAPVHPRTSHAFWDFPKKAGHYQNKKTAVQKCVHLLMGVHSCEYVNNLLKLNSKMDDIADAYLNAIWYLRTTCCGKI